MKKKYLALLTALALLLTLLTACGGGQQNKPEPSPAPVPVENTEPSQPSGTPDPAPAETPPDQLDEPADPQEPADAPQPEQEDVQPEEEPAPEDAQPSEPVSAPTEPEPEPEPAPEPGPEPEPEPEGESVRAGDTYTISVTLEGGTGRATVESPAKLRCDETGKCWATIVWSSPNFDYMKVDGEKYELISEPGANSTFEIPVSAFNEPLAVIADTVAMSEPHEVEYTLTFDSASMQDA